MSLPRFEFLAAVLCFVANLSAGDFQGKAGAGSPTGRRIEIPLDRSSQVQRPLPVYWITTQSPEYGPNVAPVVTLSGLTHHPGRQTVAINPKRKTFQAIMDTGEFVANMPVGTAANLDILWDSAWGGFRRGQDKLSLLEIPTVPSRRVAAPSLANAIASIEYSVIEVLRPSAETGADRPVIVVEPVHISVDPEHFDPATYSYRQDAPIPMHFGGNVFLVNGERILANARLRAQGLVVTGQKYFEYISTDSLEYISDNLLARLRKARMLASQKP